MRSICRHCEKVVTSSKKRLIVPATQSTEAEQVELISCDQCNEIVGLPGGQKPPRAALYRFKNSVHQNDDEKHFAPYKGHQFVISHYLEEDETGRHAFLLCVDNPAIIVKGAIHTWDLEKIL